MKNKLSLDSLAQLANDTKQKGFGSDNHAPVHPKIIAALSMVNEGYLPSYGTDLWTQALSEVLALEFGTDTFSSLVFNGTGANVLALRAICNDTDSVLCSDYAHIYESECGAPERIAGIKLIALASQQGKITLDQCKKALIRRGDQHFAQITALSITQPTELGTVYTIEEVKKLCDWAHGEGLKVHMDGARIANAAAFFKKRLREISFDLGIDILTLGGTKNGLMMGELVLFPNKKKMNSRFSYLRKQCLQLPSKSRYVAVQFLQYFENDLWLEIANHSCLMAQKLKLAIERECHDLQSIIRITQPVQSNAVFVTIPKAVMKELRQHHFFYVWDENTFECRIMCAFDTDETDVLDFALKLKELSQKILFR